MILSDLSPFPASVDWEGNCIQLRPFDLRAITWAERFFSLEDENGFERMNEILRSDLDQNLTLNTVIDVVYHLGEIDLNKIKIQSASDFKQAIVKGGRAFENLEEVVLSASDYASTIKNDSQRESELKSEIEKAIEYLKTNKQKRIAGVIYEFQKALKEILEDSFPKKRKEPEVKGGEIYKKLTANKKESRGSTNWDRVYIDFYRAGGMTIEQFFSLTMKQIDILHPELTYKDFEDLKFTAGLHGRKMSGNVTRREEQTEFTPEDVSAFEKMHERLTKEGRIN